MKEEEEEKRKIKEKHLEFIQNIISRHNSNSFMIKGWAISILTAILAIAFTIKEPLLAIIAIIPISIFWYLDSTYLANERCFVSLYSAVVNNNNLIVNEKDLIKDYEKIFNNNKDNTLLKTENGIIIKTSDYSMNFSDFQIIKKNNTRDAFCSKTIKSFYLILISFSILLTIYLCIMDKPSSDIKSIQNKIIEIDSINKYKINPNIINNIYINDSLLKK